MIERVRAFTYDRQRLGRRAPDAATALADVMAVYSSHPSAPLALAARSASFDAAAFRAIAEAGLRLPAMRGSIHLMPADAGVRAFRALPESAAGAAARLRGFGITEDYPALRERLLVAAAEPRTQAELTTALDEPADRVKGATAAMAREGALVRIGAPGLRSNALRYVAAELPEHDRDEALAWLAGEYLRTLGPARRADVAWWLGVPKGRADAALAAHDTVDVGGGLLLLAQDAPAFARAAPAPAGIDLLGKWDPLTMGHAPDGRGRAGLEPRCYDVRGDGLPVVLADGVAVGTWSLTLKGGFALEAFERPGARLRTAIDARAAEVAALLG